MEFDNSWRALLNPGAATVFFDPPPSAPLVAEPEYTPTNAWWLAELSRLVYRGGAGGAAARDRILAAVGLRERLPFHRRSTHSTLYEARDGSLAILAFRGTDGPRDWLINLRTALAEWTPGGSVHAGFKRALDTLWPRICPALDELGDTPILYTGHSLGGALATLAASRRAAAARGGVPVAVYSFGAPRVGDAEFADTLRDVPVHRVINRRDRVPGLPPRSRWLSFRHASKPRRLELLPPTGTGEGVPKLPGRRRWFDPPPRLCDHAPVNYVACLERLVRG